MEADSLLVGERQGEVVGNDGCSKGSLDHEAKREEAYTETQSCPKMY